MAFFSSKTESSSDSPIFASSNSFSSYTVLPAPSNKVLSAIVVAFPVVGAIEVPIMVVPAGPAC